MPAFREVPSKQRNGQPSPTWLGTDRCRGTDVCKCGSVAERTDATIQNKKLSGLLIVNKQLLEENELLRQCIMRLVENSDLRSMNALTMVLSQNDERLRHFISESILRNSPREKDSSPRETRFNAANTSSPKSLNNTSKSKSYGTSFKEIQLSELNDDTFVKTQPRYVTNSESYTVPRFTQNPSPDLLSRSSYGNWSKGINLSDLAVQTRVSTSNGSPNYGKSSPSHTERGSYVPDTKSYGKSSPSHTERGSYVPDTKSYGKSSPSHTERGSYVPDTKSYGKSFKEVNFSDLFSPMNSGADGRYATSTKGHNGEITSTFNSYGQPFPEINIRELGEDSEIRESLAHSQQATLSRTSSLKSRRNDSVSSKRHQTSPIVRQPPMRFGLGTSPYQKSPSSPMTEKSPTRYTVTEQSIVSKSAGRNKNRRRENTPHYSPYQISKTPKLNKSTRYISRPSSSPVKNVRTRKPQTPRSYSARVTSEPLERSSPINHRESLSALLKQVLSSPHDKIPTQSPNTGITKQQSSNIPIGILKQTTKKLHMSFSDDSLDKSVDRKPMNSFTKNTTTSEPLRPLEQKTSPSSSKTLSTLGALGSPVLSSTKKYETYNQTSENKIPRNFIKDNVHSIDNDKFSWKPVPTMKDIIVPQVPKISENGKEKYAVTDATQSIETRHVIPPAMQMNQSQRTENIHQSRAIASSNIEKDVLNMSVTNEKDKHILMNTQPALPTRSKSPVREQGQALERSTGVLETPINNRYDTATADETGKHAGNQGTLLPMLSRVAQNLPSQSFKQRQSVNAGIPYTNDVPQQTADNTDKANKNIESPADQRNLMISQGQTIPQQRIGELTANLENVVKQNTGNVKTLTSNEIGNRQTHIGTEQRTTSEQISTRNNVEQSLLNRNQTDQNSTSSQQGFTNNFMPLGIMSKQEQMGKLFPKTNSDNGMKQMTEKALSPNNKTLNQQLPSLTKEQPNKTLQLSKKDNAGKSVSTSSQSAQNSTSGQQNFSNQVISKDRTFQQQQISEFYPVKSIVKQRVENLLAPANVDLAPANVGFDHKQNDDNTELSTKAEQPRASTTASPSVSNKSQIKQMPTYVQQVFADNLKVNPVEFDRQNENGTSDFTTRAQKPKQNTIAVVGNPIANSTPKNVTQSGTKSPLSPSGNAKYILYRAIDALLGYRPNLGYISSVLQTFGRPDTHIIGEICFQLDRRILEFVFDSLEDKMRKRRSRYYGYSVASILQLIDKEVRYADDDAEVNNVLRYRLEEILKKLQSLGYNMEWHAEFAQDMVNQFGLLNGEAEPGSLEYIGMREPAIFRVVIGQTIHDSKDLDGMLIILDCLLYMAHHDGRKLFIW
ncbi:spermatogenesis and centriole associated [Mactra antiquata]